MARRLAGRGAPDRRASGVSAFRIVRLEPGSAVATLIAEHGDDAAEQLSVGDLPMALMTLGALAADIVADRELAEDVVDSLERARRACGDDGVIELNLPRRVVPTRGPIRIDAARMRRLTHRRGDGDGVVESISGRLHAVNLEPDRLVIRAPDGVEWACTYGEELEPEIRELLGEAVWAAGRGQLTGPLNGTMRVARIELAAHGRQSELFVQKRLPLAEQLARQGVEMPQGLDAVADADWVGDESDERYLAALSGDV